MPDAAPASTPIPSNLPLALTSFIGREQQMAEVAQLLTETRLLTLTGAGGCGKTRLALEVAAELLDEYTDGVWLVELASLADPQLVPHAVAQRLDVREVPGQPLLATLLAALRAKRLLLVIDNCEHLVEACAVLADALLHGCPRVQILATSREALGITGETTWRVPSLGLPDPTARRPEEVEGAEAVRLFVQRARAAQPHFALTAQNASAVVQICQQLDGIPLALELAAVRVKALTAEQIAARLDDRLRLLTGGSRTALPRQQTLRATLDWSYELLTEAERTVVRRLTVFAGGWPLEAAEAVCTGEGIAAAEVLDLLIRLVDKSLVQAEEDDGTVRYRLLETVRQYAAERLARAGEVAAVRARHATYVCALAERAQPLVWGGADWVAWMRWLTAEYDNVRVALAWCLEQDPERGVRLAGCLWPFWRARSAYTEGRRWLEGLLARAPARTVTRARALLGAALLARVHGDLAVAQAWSDEGLALSREVGDACLMADWLGETGAVCFLKGDFGQARARLEEGVALSRGGGYQRSLGVTLYFLGRIAQQQGDYGRARACLEECLALGPIVGENGSGATQFQLGLVVLCQGDARRAETLAEESLVVGQQIGSPQSVAMALDGLGHVAAWRGDLARATQLYEESLALARSVEYTHGIAGALAWLGQVALYQGDAAGAVARLEESLALFRVIGSRYGRGIALHGLGLVAWRQGDAVGATGYLRESLTLRQETGERLGIAECLEGLAMVVAGQQASRAARLLGAAQVLRETIGAPRPLVERPRYEATVQAVRASLGERAFTAARAAGQALSLEDAVGEALVDEPLAETRVGLPSAARPAAACPSLLSQREREVAVLVARGLSNPQIGVALAISERTAEGHVRSILNKCGYTSRVQIATWVAAQGWLAGQSDEAR